MDLTTCPPRVEPTFSFTQGLIVGQLSVVLLVAAFIKFFIFGDPPSPEATASQRASERRSRTEAHKKSLLTLRAGEPDDSAAAAANTTPTTQPQSQHPHKDLDRRKSSVLRRPPVLTISSILNKTYYRVDSHQPESLDWFNVLIAQTIAQFRNDAQHDDAILTSLTKALNGTSRPDFVDEIRVTELSLGEDFPIFSNCRIIPVDEDGLGFTSTSTHGQPGFAGMGMGGMNMNGGAAAGATRLQARMDVDLSDMITLAVETKLLMNYPRRLSAVLPVALAVSVVRFSGTLSVSFVPSNPSQGTPTKMIFAFLDDYRLDFSIRSLLGSRSRLQDVPKIAQLIESRLHRWFDERAVEPRFQEIELPSLWPRMKNARGGGSGGGPPSEDVSMSDSGANTTNANVPSAPKRQPSAPGLDALRQGRPESRDSRDSGATNNTRDPRREAETENWVERQVPLTAAGAVAAASSVPHHMHSHSHSLSSASQTTQAQPIQSNHHLRPSQDSLRYRRRSRADDAFSMPGSLPDMSIG